MERKEKFTPGKWEYKPYSGGYLDSRQWNGNDLRFDEIGEIYKEADGYLCAAAPEMYDCICDALTDLQMSDGMRSHFENVLKKARGEE